MEVEAASIEEVEASTELEAFSVTPMEAASTCAQFITSMEAGRICVSF